MARGRVKVRDRGKNTMNKEQQLLLEVLSGPLDGAIITLETEAEWSRAGKGPLIFRFDYNLRGTDGRLITKRITAARIRSAHCSPVVRTGPRIILSGGGVSLLAIVDTAWIPIITRRDSINTQMVDTALCTCAP